ncbi:Cytidine deaminase [Citricoccus sp. K5]|nr:Cytidine deaminase [Citricoccus sp. K5]
MEHHDHGSSGAFSDPFEDDIPLTASLPRITGTGSGIDWQRLESTARAAMTRAYVPYSRFPVGAAALVEDGRVVAGCNIENASLGLTLCAECSLVSNLQMSGGGRIVAFYCVDGNGEVLMPCGRCRQLLYEFHAPGMRLMGPDGELTMDEVLPHAFGPADMTHLSGGTATTDNPGENR